MKELDEFKVWVYVLFVSIALLSGFELGMYICKEHTCKQEVQIEVE